jgi:hypothetical protein
MTTIREQFLSEIEAYLTKSGMVSSDFGIATMGDPSFVLRLRGGSDPKASTIDKVRRWMHEHPLARRQRKAEARSAA